VKGHYINIKLAPSFRRGRGK